MIQELKPKLGNFKQFAESKNQKSISMFQYGILIDELYKDNSQIKNIIIYICPDNTQLLSFLQYDDDKLKMEFMISLLDIAGISDKPLVESHKKIQKQSNEHFYLGVQYNYEQIDDRKHKFNEMMFKFKFESTKNIFWQGLENIINQSQKEFEKHNIQIFQQLKDKNPLSDVKAFVKYRLPQINDFYLDQIVNQFDENFQDYLDKQSVLDIMKTINLNENIKTQFQQCGQEFFNDPFMPSMEFNEFQQKFQVQMQKDKPYSDIFIIQNLRKINPLHDIKTEKLTFYDFCFMIQDNNPILNKREKVNDNTNLNEYYIFNHVFKGENLKQTIVNTLNKGCIYFNFTLVNGQLQIPFFQIQDQQLSSHETIDLFLEKIQSQDFSYIIEFDVKCNNEQLINLISIIQKKLGKFIFKENNSTLNNLNQKIIFLSDYQLKDLQSITYAFFQAYSQNEGQKLFQKNQKGLTNDNKSGLGHLKGTNDIKLMDYMQTGFQLINLQSEGIEKLLYLSKFQKPCFQQYEPIYKKPQFLITTPGKYPVQDFQKPQKQIQFEILYGFQMGGSPCYLQVQIKGIPQDENKNGIYISKIMESGLKPNFNFSMNFELYCSELAFILIQVFEKRYDSNDILKSYIAFNVEDAKSGLRKINLRDIDFTPNPDSYLIAQFNNLQ